MIADCPHEPLGLTRGGAEIPRDRRAKLQIDLKKQEEGRNVCGGAGWKPRYSRFGNLRYVGLRGAGADFTLMALTFWSGRSGVRMRRSYSVGRELCIENGVLRGLRDLTACFRCQIQRSKFQPAKTSFRMHRFPAKVSLSLCLRMEQRTPVSTRPMPRW